MEKIATDLRDMRTMLYQLNELCADPKYNNSTKGYAWANSIQGLGDPCFHSLMKATSLIARAGCQHPQYAIFVTPYGTPQ
jgi:hypothetical protein